MGRAGRPPVYVPPGKRFGRLTVLREGPSRVIGGRTRRIMVCSCACGTPEASIRLDLLRNGDTSSCGCVRREKASARVRASFTVLKDRIDELEKQVAWLNSQNGQLRAELEMHRQYSR